jgi:hypothetical protein
MPEKTLAGVPRDLLSSIRATMTELQRRLYAEAA